MAIFTPHLLTKYTGGAADLHKGSTKVAYDDGGPGSITVTHFRSTSDVMDAYNTFVTDSREKTLTDPALSDRDFGIVTFAAKAYGMGGVQLATLIRVVTWGGGWTEHECHEWIDGEPQWNITEGQVDLPAGARS